MFSIDLNDLVDKLDFDTPSSLPKLGVYKVGLHCIQMFFAFIALCVTAPVISAENTYTGSSKAAPNYTLAVTIITLFVSAPLAIFPWTVMSKKGLNTIRNFFQRPRTTVILTCFMTVGWFAAMISMTVHSNNSANCSIDSKMKDDKNYVSAWSNQCNCAKASAAFSWFSFIVGVLTVVCSAILLWHEKKLRHAEINNQIKTANVDDIDATHGNLSSSSYDDDARTIVNMKYSEQDKQPIASYEGSLTGISPSASPQMQETNEARSYLPSPPVTASAITSSNDFASPYSPSAPTSTYSPVPTPYNPQSNIMASVGYAGSPYSTTNTYSPQPQPQQSYSPYQAPASYNGSPYSYHQQAPYPANTTTPQAYRSSPLYQQTTASPTVYQQMTPSPLSQQQIPPTQMYQQPPLNYIPQEYNPHLANI